MFQSEMGDVRPISHYGDFGNDNKNMKEEDMLQSDDQLQNSFFQMPASKFECCIGRESAM